jgi:hypothetical protein
VPKWVDVATKGLEEWNLQICDAAESMLSEDVEIAAVDNPAIYASGHLATQKADTSIKRNHLPIIPG